MLDLDDGDTLVVSGTLDGFTDNGTTWTLWVLGEDGKRTPIHADHRMADAIWMVLAGEWVDVVDLASGIRVFRGGGGE